jgi:cell division protein FtsB
MKYLIVFALALLVVTGSSSAYGQGSAQELAASLRSQLAELETKQSALQTRLQDLDERMKPENIEESLAGVGSTRPEDLREQKRRGLELERNGVQKQLDLLAASRTRLEASIARADAEAYRQSAAPQAISPQITTVEPSSGSAIVETKTVPAPRRQPRKKRSRRIRRTHHIHTSVGVPIAHPGIRTLTALGGN